MPAVSVIVLVYKVEQFIEQCARSLFGQTLQDLEFIFVDDCSPDASMDILEQVLADYPDRRSQVKILRNEVNRGQAYSRRRGVEAATGDYVIHCDSDDWPEPEMYARMYAKASQEKLDMVICSARRVFPDHTEIVRGVTHTDDLLESLLFQDIFHYLWNKLIVRKAYESPLYWPQNNICEDSALVLQLATYCHKWGFIEDVLYNYRFVPNSITSVEDTVGKLEQIRGNVDLAVSFLDNKGLSKKYGRAILYFKWWVKSMALKFPRKYYMSLYSEINLPIFITDCLSVSERLGHLSKVLGLHGISKIFSRKS